MALRWCICEHDPQTGVADPLIPGPISVVNEGCPAHGEYAREREVSRERLMESILIYQRGVEPADRCPDCGGWGRKTYLSTAMWMGGIGGQALTSGVCDRCWGSGDVNRPWSNLRRYMGAHRAWKKAMDESDYCAVCDCHPSSGHAKGCVMT